MKRKTVRKTDSRLAVTRGKYLNPKAVKGCSAELAHRLILRVKLRRINMTDELSCFKMNLEVTTVEATLTATMFSLWKLQLNLLLSSLHFTRLQAHTQDAPLV